MKSEAGGVHFKMELINRVHSDNECFYPQVSEGLVLRDGTRLKYPINGIIGSCFMVVLFCFFGQTLLCDYDTC